MAKGERIYFSGLNGIRAIAAMTVVVYHIDQNMPYFNLQSTGFYKTHWQSYAVTLFFVLSGFLITYLLSEEKSRTSDISLKNFYIRRILRIWPLYYLIVLLTVALYYASPALALPTIPSGHLALYGFLLANVVNVIAVVSTPLTPLWSIGVEEQFYAVWPVIVKRSGNLFQALLGVVVVCLIAKACAKFSGNPFAMAFFDDTRIDCMAIGGIGSVLYRQKSRIVEFLYLKPVQIACWGLFVYSFLFHPVHVRSSINHELYSMVFIVIILNVSTNPASIVNLENRVLNFLGNISYGLYVYHMLVIFIMKAMLANHSNEAVINKPFVYLTVILSTISIAYLSWRFVEMRFLNLKDRFSVVLSQGMKTGE